VTVCIAAIAGLPDRANPYIVTASDTMVSGGIISADKTAVKAEPFHSQWVAMMSGDDITQCIPIIEKAKEYFQKRNNTLAVARAVFKRAFQRHLIEMRQDAVLGGYGMSMEDFLRNGKRRFADKQFQSMCERMEAIDPKCEFLVYGFDSQKRPHMFHVDNAGTDGVLDRPGFSAIGSGKWAAETILYYLGQSIDKTLEETIFNVCAAKFAAERAVGIGPHTYLYVKRFNSTLFQWKFKMIDDEIRKAWNEQGAPRVPDGIVEAIRNARPTCLP